MTKLVQELASLKFRGRIPDIEFAENIGLSPRMWSMVVRGQRNLGRNSLTAILRMYPKLIGEVMYYLFTEK